MIRNLIATAFVIGVVLNVDVHADQPNIIVLLADDLGYGELGCQGNPQIPTPHIDSIAAEGIRFTDGYVTGAFCSTSRAGLMTGRYQTRFGYEFNPIGAANEDPRVGMPANQLTLAEMLHDSGYTTALIGKWHLGGHALYHPFRHGFDAFFGFTHEGHYFVPPPYDGVTTMLRRRTLPGLGKGRWTSDDRRMIYTSHMGYDEPDYNANNPIVRGSQPVNETAYLTDALTREAVDFIGRNQDRPFFLYLAYNAVHSPLQGADQYMEKFAHIEDVHRRIFAAMLANLDDSVGAVLNKLDKEDLSENTLVVFLSDNGGPTRELTSSNLPLRGGKGDMYEGGIRIPFMMRYPGKLPASKVERRPVISLDLFPTCAALAGWRLPRNHPLDGTDLFAYLNNSAGEARTLYWRQQRRTALRHGDWKLVRNPSRGGSADWELYNLAGDLGEERNLAGSNAEQREAMISRWEKLDAEMVEPFWSPR